MNSWECSVCGYVHKEEKPPEKCPVCEAPEQMFRNSAEAQEDTAEQPVSVQAESDTTTDTAAPQAPAGEPAPPTPPVSQEKPAGEKTEKRWRCTVCGYIHTGPEPPEKCPVCDAPKKMFVEIDADGKALTEVGADEVDPALAAQAGTKEKDTLSLFDKFANFSLKHHIHPISVHIPNGIIPAVVIFLALAIYFNIVSLETAAYYNLIFVLVTLPLVLLTGFIEWQNRYKGIKSAIFIMKIICSLLILVLLTILVFWRLIDPQVVSPGAPYQYVYLGLSLLLLAIAGIAGLLGGKLLFGRRG